MFSQWDEGTRAVPDSSNAWYGTIRTTARLFAGRWQPLPTIRLLLWAGIAVTYSPQSPRRTQRLFWVVIHPKHLCALGGLGGEYFSRPTAH
jgi:hypothetical protein